MQEVTNIKRFLFLLKETNIVRDLDSFLNMNIYTICMNDEMRKILEEFDVETVIDFFQKVPDINPEVKQFRMELADAAKKVFG